MSEHAENVNYARHFTLRQFFVDSGKDPATALAMSEDIKAAIARGEITRTEVKDRLGISGWYDYDMIGADFPEAQFLAATERRAA